MFRVSRRNLLIGGVSTLAGAGVLARRLFATIPFDDWHGRALTAREAEIVLAAGGVVLPPESDTCNGSAKAVADFVFRVDAYVARLPARSQREIHLLLALVEQLAPLTLPSLKRFSQAPKDTQRAILQSMLDRGGVSFQSARGLRDLCFFGYYAGASAWPPISFEGPWVGSAPREASAAYARLRAAKGTLPDGART